MAAQIAPVAAEQLVAADAGEDDRDVAARELRDQVGGDERGVGDRLVHLPEQLGQKRRDVGPDEDLVVLGAEALRHLSGVRQLVVIVLGLAAAEADRIGLDRAIAVPPP